MNKQNILNQRSTTVQVDAYSYSRKFELEFEPVLLAFFNALDLASTKIKIDHKLRLLTKIEHNRILRSQFVFRFANKFGLDRSQSISLGSILLLEGARDALSLASSPVNPDKTLINLGFQTDLLQLSKTFIPWYRSKNILDFLDNSTNKWEFKARLLHYLSQLSVFTSTPKDPSECPYSAILSPSEFCNSTNMWARKPELYETNLFLTSSGKKILSKADNIRELGFRENLGLLIDLHLRIANELWERCLPMEQNLHYSEPAALLQLA